MNEQAIRFRIGIFVLASLILLAVMITLFGGFPNYFKHLDTYTIVFKDAQGVAPGPPCGVPACASARSAVLSSITRPAPCS